MKIKDSGLTSDLIEYTLQKNDYTDELLLSNHLASITMLLNLMYMTTSTYPDMPYLMFDIESRIHFLDTGTDIGLIETELNKLIDTYLSDSEIVLAGISRIDEGLEYNFEIAEFTVTVTETVTNGILDVSNFTISSKNFNA
jgi:hypothetical protein